MEIFIVTFTTVLQQFLFNIIFNNDRDSINERSMKFFTEFQVTSVNGFSNSTVYQKKRSYTPV